MTYFKTINILLTILVSSVLAELSCDVNEIVDDCPSDCGYHYCPKDELQDKKPCPKPEVCPPPACKCRFNHRRAENGTCIPSYECPPFECNRENEYYEACPPLCPGQDCSEATPSGRCPFFLLLVIECRPTCKCINNHWRSNGVCVPFLECPNIKDKIKRNDTSYLKEFDFYK